MAVVLFSTSGCRHCTVAREYLIARGISYRQRDPSRNRAALTRLVSLTGRASVPTLAVGRDVCVGFDRARWSDMLGRI